MTKCKHKKPLAVLALIFLITSFILPVAVPVPVYADPFPPGDGGGGGEGTGIPVVMQVVIADPDIICLALFGTEGDVYYPVENLSIEDLTLLFAADGEIVQGITLGWDPLGGTFEYLILPPPEQTFAEGPYRLVFSKAGYQTAEVVFQIGQEILLPDLFIGHVEPDLVVSGSPALVSVPVGSENVEAGSAVTVTLYDSISLSNAVAAETGTIGENGTAMVSFNVPGTLPAGAYYFSACVGDTYSWPVMFIIGPDGGKSSVSAGTDPVSPLVNETFVFTVDVRDANDNPISGLQETDFFLSAWQPGTTIPATGGIAVLAVAEGASGHYTVTAVYNAEETIDLQVGVLFTPVGTIPSVSVQGGSADAQVIALAVKTLPVKTSYTAGEELDLSGLEVTLIKSDQSMEDVALADFADKGITTDPANGAVLETVLEQVAITHVQSGKTVDLPVTVVVKPTYQLLLETNPAAGGTVTGGGSYEEGTQVTVTAVANQGYVFAFWYEDGERVSASADYTVTMSADKTLVANFAQTITEEVCIDFEPPAYTPGELPRPWNVHASGDGYARVTDIHPYAGEQALAVFGRPGTSDRASAVYLFNTDPADGDFQVKARVRPISYNPGNYEPGYVTLGGLVIVNNQRNYDSHINNVNNAYRTELSITFEMRKPYGATLDPQNHLCLNIGNHYTTPGYSSIGPFIRGEYHEIIATWDYAENKINVLITRPDGVTYEHTLDASGRPLHSMNLDGSNARVLLGGELLGDACRFDNIILRPVTGTIVPDTYAVTFAVAGANGSLAASVEQEAIVSGAEVEAGKDLSFVAVPDAGYCVKQWKINDEVVPDNKTNNLLLENLQAPSHVTVEFEEAEVIAVAVKTLPVKTSYTVGEALDLSGLEVTLTKFDQSMEDVALADFAAKGLTTDPADGTILETVLEQVAITHVQSGLAVNLPITVVVKPTYQLLLETNPTAGGTVTGGGRYEEGTEVTVTAIANPGYVFAFWYENGIKVSKDASYTVTMSANKTLVASFAQTIVEEILFDFEPPACTPGELPRPWNAYARGEGYARVTNTYPYAGEQALAISGRGDSGSSDSAEAEYLFNYNPIDGDFQVKARVRPSYYNPGRYDPGYASMGTFKITNNQLVPDYQWLYQWELCVHFQMAKPYGVDFNPDSHLFLNVHNGYTTSTGGVYNKGSVGSFVPGGYHEITATWDYTENKVHVVIERPDGIVYEKTLNAGGHHLRSVLLYGQDYPYPADPCRFDNIILGPVTGTIVPDTYAVTFAVAGANGSLAASVDQEAIVSGAEVEAGKDLSFAAVPDAGYCVKQWKINDEVVPDNKTNNLLLADLQEPSYVTVEFEEAQVTAIALKTLPAKTFYTVGEALDLSGLVVTLTRADQSTEDVALVDFADKGITTDPANGTVLENILEQVAITHAQSGLAVNLPVTVVAEVIALAVKIPPVKTDYTVGEALDLSGLVVTLTRADQSTEDVALVDFADKGITTDPANGTVLENILEQVAITHAQSGLAVNLPVTVVAEVIALAVKIPPVKTDYTVGEALDLSGLEVTLTKSDQSIEDVGLADFTDKGITTDPADGTVLENVLEQVTITHAQSGLAVNLPVTVVAEVIALAVKIPPVKTDYTVGEALDLSGLVVTLTKSDQSIEDVGLADFTDKGITTDPANGTVLENILEQVAITHAQSGLAVNLPVTVVAEVIALAVKIPPVKTDYTVGEALDLSGLVVTLTRADQSTEDVALVDFADKGITTDPANGTVLENILEQVAITHAQSGLAVNLPVTVVAEVIALAVKIPPVKTDYTVGEALDLSGLEVTLTKSDQSIEDVGLADFTDKGITTDPADGTVLENILEQVAITHAQSGLAVNLPVTVVAEVIALAVKIPPVKTDYTVGEALDLSGLEVTLTKSDQSMEDVALADFAAKGLTTDPVDGTVLNTVLAAHVTITHAQSGKTVDLSITVFEATTEEYDFSLQLGSGWNLLSIPKQAEALFLAEEDILAWLSYGVRNGQAGWLAVKEDIQSEMENPASAVFIKTKKPTEIKFRWKEFEPQDSFAGKQLAAGWNLVGSGISAYLKNVLSPLKNNIAQIYAPNFFNNSKEVGYSFKWLAPLLDLSEWNKDNFMYRLDGYWIYVQSDGLYYTTVVDPEDVQDVTSLMGAEGSGSQMFSLPDEAPVPFFPALCYGDLLIDGEPAPPGTVLEARVDGETIGSITITEEGVFGGPGLETKLALYGSDLEGKLVEFYALVPNEDLSYTEVKAGETIYWGSGQVLGGMNLLYSPDAPLDECFIATAAFGSKMDPGVTILRQFRDAKLLTNIPGQAFVRFYYRVSPGIARYIAGNNPLKMLIRTLLLPVIALAYLCMHPWLLLSVFLLASGIAWCRRRRRLLCR